MRNKSVHELRGIAQSFGIADIFSKDAAQLIQAIELKRTEMIPKAEIVVPKPEYDAKLMTKPPSRKTDRQEIERYLQPYIARGLRLSFPEPEVWAMECGKKNDTGSIRMPIRVVLQCADKVIK
jgi:hypothetical protein